VDGFRSGTITQRVQTADGGIEIVVVQVNVVPVGPTDEMKLVARAAFTAITEPIALGRHRLHTLASVGYATAQVGMTATELLHRADMAMYRAKTTHTGVRSATMPASTPGQVDPRRRWRDRR